MPAQSASSRKAKAAAQDYKHAVDSNAKAVHDSLASATAKGVEEAHIRVTSGAPAFPSAPGRYSSRQLPKRLPERILALAYEVVGALAGTLAGSFFAVKELFIAAESHIKRAVGHAKKAK